MPVILWLTTRRVRAQSGPQEAVSKVKTNHPFKLLDIILTLYDTVIQYFKFSQGLTALYTETRREHLRQPLFYLQAFIFTKLVVKRYSVHTDNKQNLTSFVII